jgi:hypothetical protein
MREINQAKAILIDDLERKQAYDEDGIIKEHHFLDWKKRREGVVRYEAGGSSKGKGKEKERDDDGKGRSGSYAGKGKGKYYG